MVYNRLKVALAIINSQKMGNSAQMSGLPIIYRRCVIQEERCLHLLSGREAGSSEVQKM